MFGLWTDSAVCAFHWIAFLMRLTCEIIKKKRKKITVFVAVSLNSEYLPLGSFAAKLC